MRLNNQTRFYWLILIGSLLNANFAWAQNVNYAGTSVANFLKIGIGARGVALGEAVVTESKDASSLYWNPGAIARIEGGSAVFSSIPWLVDSEITYSAVTIHALSGVIGVDFHQFSSGEMEETTLRDQEGTGRFFEASDLQLGVAYSRALTDRFSLGVKLRYLREDLANVYASSYAFDIGSLFYTNFFGGMKLGMTLSNFGGRMAFEGRDLSVLYDVPDSPSNKSVPATLATNDWEIPLFFRAGIALNPINTSKFDLALLASVIDGRDQQANYHLGAEIGMFDILFLRAGYKVDSPELADENGSESSYSLGVGLDLSLIGVTGLSFDYSYLDFGRFDIVQQYSIAVGF